MTTERERFEAWLVEKPWHTIDRGVLAWDAWQARAALDGSDAVRAALAELVAANDAHDRPFTWPRLAAAWEAARAALRVDAPDDPNERSGFDPASIDRKDGS